MTLIRFGVGLEEDILKSLDRFVIENKLPNRSQAIRHLIEKTQVEKKWQCNNMVAGSITIVYDHHKRDILSRLTDMQHDYNQVILSSQHFHLDHDKCLEIIAVKGRAAILTELSDKLIAVKGIQHGKLTMSRAD